MGVISVGLEQVGAASSRAASPALLYTQSEQAAQPQREGDEPRGERIGIWGHWGLGLLGPGARLFLTCCCLVADTDTILRALKEINDDEEALASVIAEMFVPLLGEVVAWPAYADAGRGGGTELGSYAFMLACLPLCPRTACPGPHDSPP